MFTGGGIAHRVDSSVLVVLALLYSSAGVAHAGINPSTTNDTVGGSVLALAIDPQVSSTLYAATNKGVFKSTDAGLSWKATGDRTDYAPIVIDPLVPSTLYAGPGLSKSTDGGVNWETLNQSANTLAIDPLTPNTLYAATFDGGLVKSTDGGVSWNASNTGLPSVYSPPISALAIDPLTPSTLYAGKRHGNSQAPGVFKSTDGGASWHFTGLNSFDINALAIDPLTPSILYAGEYGGDGLVKTTDSGATWSSANSGLPGPYVSVLALAVDPHSPTTLYAIVTALDGPSGGAVFRSTDGGQSWGAMAAGVLSANVLALAVDPLTPAALYAGTAGNGVFKSTDGGASWVASSAGLILRFVVDSTVDAPDGVPGDGVCATAASQCTLRAAIGEANASPGADTIRVPAGLYVLSGGTLTIADDLTIVGDGPDRTIIDGNQNGTVVSIATTSATICGATIQSGRSWDNNDKGGGIVNRGQLALSNVTVKDNTAESGGSPPALGGGIYNLGEATLTDVTIAGNTAGPSEGPPAFGGGIYNAGTATLINVTVSGNRADTYIGQPWGGGIYNSGLLTATNCTISGNTAAEANAYMDEGRGGGIYNDGNATLINVTVTDNRANATANACGGICNGSLTSEVTLQNVIVTDSGEGGNCSGAISSLGHNLDSDGTCGLAGPSDLSNRDARLAPLQNNGGLTLTHALLPGSPAIDAGGTDCPSTDQRGVNRPQGGACDIGAYEFERPTCAGDCNYNGIVTIEEIVTLVNLLFQDAGSAACSAADPEHTGIITVAQIVQAVNSALHGCVIS